MTQPSTPDAAGPADQLSFSSRQELLLAILRERANPAAHRIPRRDPAVPAPLSFAQQGLWLVHRMEPESAAYNVPYALRVRGGLDVAALRRGLDALVARHESLRTTVGEHEGEPVQVIGPPRAVPLPVADLRAAPDAETLAHRLAAAEAARPFDLARGPLLRALLLRLDEHDHVLCVTLHHVVSDGWSMGVMVREVSALYAAFARGAPPALPPLPLQYADYAAWQRGWMRGEVLERELAYWRDRLAGAPPLLEVPTDRPRAGAAGARGERHRFVLPAGLAHGLRALARRRGATLFMTLLAGWQVLLGRYAGQGDVVVGTPVAGRSRPELEGLIGFFINMLPLRLEMEDDPTADALLDRVRQSSLAAFAHQELPFERLVEALGTVRSQAHAPVFQVIFSLAHAQDDGGLRLGDLALTPVGHGDPEARFDLSLNLYEGSDTLPGVLEYRAALFDAPTIERMADHLRTLLQGMVDDPGRRVSRLPLLAAAEREHLLRAWNGAEAGYRGDLCLHELVHRQVLRTPGAPALLYEDVTLTYDALFRRACRLAHRLRRAGVGPEVRVAICMEPAPEMVVAVLGVMLAGGAYLPLDPELPRERRDLLLRTAAPVLVLTQPALAERLADCPVPRLPVDGAGGGAGDGAGDGADAQDGADGEDDGVPASGVHPRNLAYVIFTSGSTGQPKGVLMEHYGMGNTVRELARVYGSGPGDRNLLFAPLHFD
ncbi:condensation domain-containing protein, partial [Longimicrobium sp.]|uniref:condensation domain-containing protein n=1 Tax=Longimicrobium sp. TaxID=2029185 RepID=UPI002E32A85E